MPFLWCPTSLSFTPPCALPSQLPHSLTPMDLLLMWLQRHRTDAKGQGGQPCNDQKEVQRNRTLIVSSFTMFKITTQKYVSSLTFWHPVSHTHPPACSSLKGSSRPSTLGPSSRCPGSPFDGVCRTSPPSRLTVTAAPCARTPPVCTHCGRGGSGATITSSAFTSDRSVSAMHASRPPHHPPPMYVRCTR